MAVENFSKVQLFLSRNQHDAMKALAKRRRVTLGNLYDQAIQAFLKLPANYMSTKQERRIKNA